MRYEDAGSDYHDQQRSHARRVSHLVGQLGSLGYEVTLCRRTEPGTGGTEDTTAA